MAEAEGSEQGENQPQKESIVNVKAEFNRKLDNLTQTINTQWQDMQAVLASLASKPTAPAASEPRESKKPLKDLIYEDDASFEQAIENRIASTVEKKIRTQADQSAQLNNIVAEVGSKFPEFNQPSSEAYQAALKKHASLPQHLRGTAEGVKIAMLETVADLGLVPTSKRDRTSEADDFSLSGKGSAKKVGKKGAELDEATTFWAEAFGVKVKDEKVQERLKKYSNREWRKYE